MLVGDASLDSKFREIYVPRVGRVNLAIEFDFREKNRAGFGSLAYVLLPCHYTMKEGERAPFLRKLRACIKGMVSFVDVYF